MPFPPPAETAPDPDEGDPVVRPYTVTSGRTRPSRGRFDLTSMVVATRSTVPLDAGYGPEQTTILNLTQRPLSVAEVAARLGLPAGVVRVLLGDLLDARQITVSEPYPADHRHTVDTLEAIRDGLRAL